MFDMFAAEDSGFAEEVPEPNGDEWDKKMKLAFEKEMLGIYVSDHPLRGIAQQVRDAADYSLGELDEIKDGAIGWFAGILASVDRKPTKKGTMMAVTKLEDLDGQIEAVMFPQVYDKFRDIVVEDAVVRVKAKVENSDRGMKLMVQLVEPFNGEAFSEPPGRITVRTDGGALHNGRHAKLLEALQHYPGRDVVELHAWDEEQGKFLECRMPYLVNMHANGLHAELILLFGAEAISED